MRVAAMSVQSDTRDRVIKVESDLEHLKKQVDDMSSKVTELHTLLMQARGARWAILAMAAIGGFVSAKLSAFLPWLSPPR
jgi:uncharacterized protein YPO0396